MKFRSHRELDVYKQSFTVASRIFDLTKSFPKEEKYSLTDQIRRSSRSVTANLAEAFRRRKYPKSFVAKLVDCEGEAAETQTWLEHSHSCGYIEKAVYDHYFQEYEHIIGKLVIMGNNPDQWSW